MSKFLVSLVLIGGSLVSCNTALSSNTNFLARQQTVATVKGLASVLQQNHKNFSSQSLKSVASNFRALDFIQTGLPEPVAGITLQDVGATGCATLDGTPDDVDMDGIPDNIILTYHCTYNSVEGPTLLTGVIKLHDQNDTDASSGFEASRIDFGYTITTTGDGKIFNTTAVVDSQSTTTVAAQDLASLKYNVSLEEKTTDQKRTVLATTDVDGHYTPSGNIKEGTLQIQGVLNENVAGAPEIEVTSEGLTISKACDSGVKSGEVNYQTQNASGSLNFENCNL